MPLPPIDLHPLIAKIPQNVTALPPESSSPIQHYKRGANDAWNLLLYFDRNVQRTSVRPTVFEKHQRRLRNWVIVNLVESFERYFKEVAAVCVDHVAPLVLDDRLDVLRTTTSRVAAHYEEGSLGRALCEADTWLDTQTITRRFGRILSDHHATNLGITLFGEAADIKARTTTLKTVFQLRHAIVHNVGIVTKSDAAKLRLLTKSNVVAPSVLYPTNGDVWYVKLFLDETAESMNGEIAARLQQLLTALHAADTSLFVPAERAALVAEQFSVTATIAEASATP